MSAVAWSGERGVGTPPPGPIAVSHVTAPWTQGATCVTSIGAPGFTPEYQLAAAFATPVSQSKPGVWGSHGGAAGGRVWR